MAIRVSIDDNEWSICVGISVPGGYNPDVVDDVRRRAVDTYREALQTKGLTYDEQPMAVDDEPVTED